MTKAICVLVLCLGVSLSAEAPGIDPALLSAYHTQVRLARQVTQATYAVLLSSDVYAAHEDAKKQQRQIEAAAAKVILERTGKTIDWNTGRLSEPAK